MTEESTPPDLVERARAMFAAGDRGDIDAAIGFFVPDVVWEMVGSGIRIDGEASLRDFFQDWVDRYEDYQWRTEEALDMRNAWSSSYISIVVVPAAVRSRFRNAE